MHPVPLELVGVQQGPPPEACQPRSDARGDEMTTVSTWLWIRRPALAVLVGSLALAGGLAGQSSVRMWGSHFFDTRALDLRCVKVDADRHKTAFLRADGRIFQQGQSGGFADGLDVVPPPPSGLAYVDVAVSIGYGLGMLNDGTVVGWGTAFWPQAKVGVVDLPPLPPGLRYTQMAAGDLHAILARSDGALIGWCASGSGNFGQGNIPAIPPGLVVSEMQAKLENSAFLLSDGTLLVWGDNTDGQCNVPALPPGVTFAGMSMSGRHTLALRSDGLLEAFGSNFYGQCNVPALPPGTSYQLCAAGLYHSVALRSDGAFVAWGNNQYGQCDAPPLPAGLMCKQLVAGNYHTVARMSDGSILTWGYQGFFESGLPNLPGLPIGPPGAQHVDASVGAYVSAFTLSDGTVHAFGLNNHGQTDVPALPPGIHYTSARTHWIHSAALRSDGQLVVWGDNTYGQCMVPPLPPGTSYVRVELGDAHTVALRSDGQVVAFGDNSLGQCSIPALPPGVDYIDIDAGRSETALLRSDGVVAFAGYGLVAAPPLPSGVSYVDIAFGKYFATLRSDGEVDLWGSYAGGSFWVPVPPLPFGVYYVEAETGRQPTVLRRSDGQVVVCGTVGPPGYSFLAMVPPLDPGTSYVQVSCTEGNVGARVGPTSTYVSFSPGCAGSRSAARLVPRDTPRIGKTLQVTLFDLPVDIAVLAMGWQQVAPVSLAPLGMPGCDWHTSLDATGVLVGQGGQAKWLLPIPDAPALVGMHFYNQALVLDPAAGNGFGAVVSDAAEGVVGRP